MLAYKMVMSSDLCLL